MFFRAIAFQDFHIAGVRCGTVKDFWCPMNPPHDLTQWRIFQIRQTCTAATFWEKKIPQPCGLGLRFHLFHDRGDLPAVALAVYLFVVEVLVGIHVVCHELLDTLLEVFHLR